MNENDHGFNPEVEDEKISISDIDMNVLSFVPEAEGTIIGEKFDQETGSKLAIVRTADGGYVKAYKDTVK